MFQEFTPDQARVFIDAEQAYQAFRHARGLADSHRGSMHWKTVKGRKYLYKAAGTGRPAKCLGPESEETHQIRQAFEAGKAKSAERLAALGHTLKEQARLCKAVRINRVPSVVTAILRQLELSGMLGKNLMVIGTHALFAYEAAVSGRFSTAITTTTDVDFMWDARTRLVFASDATDIRKEGFIGLLRKVDPSFEAVQQRGFRIVNKRGFFVDLIKPAPPFWDRREPDRIGTEDSVWAAEIPSLKWLASSPKFTQVVIGDDGFPAAMVAPDPRAFALYKLWLSQQPDREPIKKQRDRLQAIAVAQAVIQRLPSHPFRENDLKAFPLEVIEQAQTPTVELPSGFFSP
jgi:hypothetical protein